MNFYTRRFNLYLLLMAGLVLAAGCASFKKKDKQMAALRVHIESPASVAGTSETIPVIRSEPVMVTIANEPILTEANIVAASLLTAPDGFAVELKFDQPGSWTLEQFSATNPGKHFVIFGQWGDKLAKGRWLAAPLINRRMAGGALIFTPDASREEAEQLVKGLNDNAKKTAADNMKQ